MNASDGGAREPRAASYSEIAASYPASAWRRLLGLVVVCLLSVLFIGLTFGIGYALHEPQLVAGATDSDLAWEFAVLSVAIAGLIPAVLLTARWVDRRPSGSVSSVAGGLRWRWLAVAACVCGGVAIGGSAIALAVEPPPRGFDDVDWRLVTLIGLIAVAAVPLQAAGEEYLFRGYLPQLAGALVRNPWLPAVVISVAFGLAHGTEQNVWAVIDRTFFGLAAAWLTIRTGGLEAAIALHAAGNIAGFTLLTVDGELETFVIGPEPAATFAAATFDMALVATVALVLERVARRHIAPKMATSAL